MEHELALVARMIGAGDGANTSSSELLQNILKEIEKTLLKESADIALQMGLLRTEAQAADESLRASLDQQQGRLVAIDERTTGIIAEFDKALDGGLRIGERLAAAEAARQQVQFAEDIMSYIRFFEESDSELPAKVLDSRSDDLRTFLPAKLATQSWLEISIVFLSLRRVLYDINTADMKQDEQASFLFAQEVVIALSTAIEGLLLAVFEGQMLRVLEAPNDQALIKHTREVVEALMSFNDGAALQKRYIFSVVAQRFVPADVSKKKGDLKTKLLQGMQEIGTTFKKAGDAVKKLSAHPTHKGESRRERRDSDSSSAGDEFDGVSEEGEEIDHAHGPETGQQKISDMIKFGRYGGPELQLENIQLGEEEDQGVFGTFLSKTLAFSRKRANSGAALGDDSSEIMDKMSRLFASLHELFTEQIVVLRRVFPLLTAQKVIKMLLQRIFNDPAFGIQGRIDAVMRSGEQVSPSYYLDVLMIVREKLSAFFLMILECTNYIGKAGIADATKTHNLNHVETAVMLWNEEIRSFLEEQVTLMLQGYTKDYFQKELTFLKGQYCDILKNAAAEEPAVLSKIVPNDPLPRIKPEKVKSISLLIGVVNSPLVHAILSVTSEAIARMGSIGSYFIMYHILFVKIMYNNVIYL